MEPSIYLIKVNVALIVLYAFYKLSFSKDTFFRLRRIMLLLICVTSLIYPLIDSLISFPMHFLIEFLIIFLMHFYCYIFYNSYISKLIHLNT